MLRISSPGDLLLCTEKGNASMFLYLTYVFEHSGDHTLLSYTMYRGLINPHLFAFYGFKRVRFLPFDPQTQDITRSNMAVHQNVVFWYLVSSNFYPSTAARDRIPYYLGLLVQENLPFHRYTDVALDQPL